MHFDIIDAATMKIVHEGSPTIIAPIREFAKTRFVKDRDQEENVLDPFKEINMYIQAKINRADQNRIYNAYKTIFDEINIGAFDVDIVSRVCNEQFIIIYNIIKVQDVHDYMERNNLFDIPTDIIKDYTGEYTEDRTYIEPKYKGLIALGMSARMAIPVWGVFSPIRKGSVGSKRIPIPLIKMLYGTSILESEQFKDLERYSDATVDAGKFDPGRIVAGFGTEYNKELNLASNFVKKVAIAPNSRHNGLAKDIYNYIANSGAYNDASSGDVVWNKKDPNQEEEKSKWEKYNLREQMSQGDICMIEHYISSTDRALGNILKGEHPEKIKAFAARAETTAQYLDNQGFIPTQENMRIAQWCLSKVVPPKTLMYIGYYYQRRALTVTVELLRYLNYPILAALLLAEVATSADGYLISFKVTRKQMPEDLERKLDELYPLNRKSRDRESGNMAKLAINRFYTEINNSVLRVVADQPFMDYLNENKVLNKHQRFSVSANTPIELGQLLVDLTKFEIKAN